jgi:hypothetical protein
MTSTVSGSGPPLRTSSTRTTQSQRDYAALWWTWPPGTTGTDDRGDPSRHGVLNLGFTGDLERHEREARRLWGGSLCVTRLPRTEAELQAVSTAMFEARSEAREAGIWFDSGGADAIHNHVRIQT